MFSRFLPHSLYLVRLAFSSSSYVYHTTQVSPTLLNAVVIPYYISFKLIFCYLSHHYLSLHLDGVLHINSLLSSPLLSYLWPTPFSSRDGLACAFNFVRVSSCFLVIVFLALPLLLYFALLFVVLLVICFSLFYPSHSLSNSSVTLSSLFLLSYVYAIPRPHSFHHSSYAIIFHSSLELLLPPPPPFPPISHPSPHSYPGSSLLLFI